MIQLSFLARFTIISKKIKIFYFTVYLKNFYLQNLYNNIKQEIIS